MKQTPRPLWALLALAAPWPLYAQAVAPAATATAKPADSALLAKYDKNKNGIIDADERAAMDADMATAASSDVVSLSPFEVSAEKDTGYQATDTLAGTRLRTDLRDVGGAITVITKEFMKDIGATDNGTLLQYTPSAEVAGTHGTYAGLGNGSSVDETGNLRAPAGAQRVRGLASADNARDFFVTDIGWDAYNVDRIEIQRGPNSILFGLGSPAGIVNATLRNAEFRNMGSADIRFGSYGSFRSSVDINQQLIPKVLSLRIDGLLNNEKYEQTPAFQNDHRIYGALRFDPQLFANRDFHTTIKVKYENADIKANRPRTVSPNDSITPWFRAVNNTSLNGGMGKYAVNNGYEIGAQPTTISPWLSGVGDQQQPVWLIDGTTNQTFRIYGGYINTGARNNDGTVRTSGQSLLGQRFSGTFYGLSSLSAYATNAGLVNSAYGQYRQASLQDDSVFNFYDNLIDGGTKKEFEKWNTHNIDITQTGWNDRVGVQFNFDRQQYRRGGQALLSNPTINIDILKNYQDLTANPNFGRAFVVGGPGGGNSYTSDRKYIRGSLFGELRSSDFFEKNSFMEKLLGKHRFNGVYSKEDYFVENRTWQMYANNRDWAAYWNRTDGSTSSIDDRPPISLIYLGSSLAAGSSAAGANLPRISAPVTLNNGGIYYFDSTWKNPAGVGYNDPYTVPSNLSAIFDSTATTQASNPANYVGWNTNFQMNLLRYNDGQDNSLLTNAQKSLRVTKSYAGSWQGFLWKDAIIPTLGWRYDEVKGKGVTAAKVSTNRNILNLQPDVYRLPDTYPANQIFKDHSTSGGVVVHVNRLFGERDPLPINVSLSYNKSQNFQVTDVRRDIYGKTLNNPAGKTKDYGVVLSTKDGKYSLRAVKYETSVSNASIQSNIVSLVGNPIQQGLRFRNVFLYKLSNYPFDTREQVQDRNTWAPAYVDSTGKVVAAGNVATAPAGATLQTQAQADAMRDASIRGWNDIQKYLQARGYFSYWGYTPTTQSALTDRATYEAAKSSPTALDPAAQYAPDPATVFAYTYPSIGPQGLTMTADTLSKGYEFELTANPTRNWRLAFNASETQAVRNNVGGPALAEFITYMDAQMAGAAGDMRQFSGGYVPGNLVRQNWANFRANYTLLTLQQNAAAPEIRKWRYNITSNYTFHGDTFLKGVGVGGSYRWQDKVIIGYPVIPGTAGQANFDLSKPYYGPSEDAIDLWVSYERRLSQKVNWKVQLNVRNAFAKDGLIPISVQPDGSSYASVRVKPIQEWFMTNTFSF